MRFSRARSRWMLPFSEKNREVVQASGAGAASVPWSRRIHRPLLAVSAAAVALSVVVGPTLAAPAQAESFGNSGRRKVAVQASPLSVGSKAKAMYGTPRSGMPWHSGAFTGQGMTAARMRVFENWAGRPSDFATVYPGYDTWSEMADSGWVTQLMTGYRGRLAYGLPLLPKDRVGQWQDVLDGSHDAVFRTIATQLVAAGRGDTAIRVGLEANGDWFAWGATYGTADEFKEAFRRVVTVMRAVAPNLTFWFDTSAGFGLSGQKSRMDALTMLYPGDAYVTGISMDHYDGWSLQAKDANAFAKALRPAFGPGLGDAADFARAHGKAFAVPEWGLHSTLGAGDNPLFIQLMYQFFQANKDVLVFEAYFNEPDPYIANALFSPSQLPKSGAAYLKYF